VSGAARVRHTWAALAVSTAARVVLGAGALLVLLSVLPTVAGWQTSVVMSGSMEPTVSPGDVVLVRPVDPADLQRGQIVLVDDPDRPGQLRMHRLVGVEDGRLRLRGDANPREDSSLVEPAAVHGTGALRLPALGLPAVWLAEQRAWPLAGTSVVLMALLGLALLHRAPEDDDADDVGGAPGASAGPDGDRDPARPIRRRAVSRGRRAAVLGGAVLALVAPVAASGAAATFTAVTTNPTSTFAAAKYWSCTGANSNASLYYPLQDAGGTTAVNSGTAGTSANGTYSSTGVTYRAAGPECGVTTESAITLDGTAGKVWTTQSVTGPQSFTVQTWFSTTTTRGGKLVGFGNGAGGASSVQYDRHVYMTNTGKLAFGVFGSEYYTVTSPSSYNDGRWHLVTATFSGTTGLRLYIDGGLVSQGSAPAAENTTGYWRIGYDNMDGWPNAPTSPYFAGSLAHVAIHTSVLSAGQVADQYGAGPLTCATQTGPSGTAAPRYWPMQEAGGARATNAGAAGSVADATYSSGGVTYGVPGPSCGAGASSAVHLDGSSGQLWTSQVVINPQIFSESIWFATTTTRGGRLLGFSSGANGATSAQFDRHIYLNNAGQVYFGVYNGGFFTVNSSSSFNNGAWHLATASFSAATGLRLYVDGVLVGSSTATTLAENTTGYWRIGYDNIGGWPSGPTSFWFAGSVAQASVYDRVLTAAEVTALYTAGS
jgi:signal peptidase I